MRVGDGLRLPGGQYEVRTTAGACGTCLGEEEKVAPKEERLSSCGRCRG